MEGDGEAHTSVSPGERPPALSEGVILIPSLIPVPFEAEMTESSLLSPGRFRAEVGADKPNLHLLLRLIALLHKVEMVRDPPSTADSVQLEAFSGAQQPQGAADAPSPSALGQHRRFLCLSLHSSLFLRCLAHTEIQICFP